MADDLLLPDQLEVKHGDDLGTVGPEAKQYYHPDEPARCIDGVHIQQFDYRFTLGDRETGVMLLNIALNTETDNYHIFVHKAGINPDYGLVGTLDYERTITSEGERIEDIEQVPERVFEAMNEYYHENHDGEPITE